MKERQLEKQKVYIQSSFRVQMRIRLFYRIIVVIFSYCVKIYSFVMGRRKGCGKGPLNNKSDSVDHRYHGLWNQGATCYLNSVLQVLFMTKDFREAVNSSSEPDIDPHLTSLFENLQKKSANTYAITKHLGITRVHEQQDAAECLEKILHRTSFKASQIFKGELTHRSTCSNCSGVSEDSRLFWSLPLTLMGPEKDDFSVTEGIKSFLRESSISGDDQIYCEQCNAKTDSTSKCELKHHPQVLTLLLKRFTFDPSSMQYVKLKRRAQIPLILQIPHNGDQSQWYELYALVEHSGELRHGHYIATIRAQDDNRWYNFNDTSVTAVPQQKNIQDYIKSQTAYLLFYKKTEATSSLDTSEMSAPKAEDKPCRDQDVKSSDSQETPLRETPDNKNVADSDRVKAKSFRKSKQGKRSAAKENDFKPEKVIKIETAPTGKNLVHKQIVCDNKGEKEKPDQGQECKNCDRSSSPAEQMEENRKGGKEQKLTKRKSAGLHSEEEVETKQSAEKNPNTGGQNLQPKETQVTYENEVKEKEKRKEDEHDHLILERSDMSTLKDCTHTNSSEVKAGAPKEASPEEQCRADLQKTKEKSEEEPRQYKKKTERSKSTYEGSDRTIRSDQMSKREDQGKATLNYVCSDREEHMEQENYAIKTEGEASVYIQVTPDVDILVADLTKMSLESPESPGQRINDPSEKLQSSTETQSFDEKNDGALKKTEALNSGKREETTKKDKKGKNKQKKVILQMGLVVP